MGIRQNLWRSFQRVLHVASASDAVASTVSKPSAGVHSLHVPEKVDLVKFAGKIAAALRFSLEHNKEPIRMRATGTNAVNAAVKSLAIARRYLSERPGAGLSFRVAHEIGADKDRISRLQFAVAPTQSFIHGAKLHEEAMEELRVKATTNGRSVGGKLAVALFNAEKALIVAIGPRAVGTSIVGLTWARRMLHQQGLDVIAIPSMRTIPLRNTFREVTGVQFILSRLQYTKLNDFDPEESFDDTEVSIIDKAL